jgi:hypothetical protein
LAPTTIPGRAIASLCCVLGILVTALPISIISNNFSVEYQRYLERKAEFEQREKMKIEALKKRLPKQAGVMKRLRSVYVISGKSEKSATSDGESISQSSSLHNSIGLDGVLDSSSGHNKVELVESNRVKSTKVISETKSPLMSPEYPNGIETDSSSKYADYENDNLTKLTSYPNIMKLSTTQINEMNIDDVRSQLLELRNEYDDLFQKHMKTVAISRDREKLAKMMSRVTAVDINTSDE